MESLQKIAQLTKQSSSEYQLLEELFNFEKNLETKTELIEPLKWATLTMITEFLEEKKMVTSAKILNDFMKSSYKLLISKNRKGREEYVKALNTINMKSEEHIGNQLNPLK